MSEIRVGQIYRVEKGGYYATPTGDCQGFELALGEIILLVKEVKGFHFGADYIRKFVAVAGGGTFSASEAWLAKACVRVTDGEDL